MKPINTLLVLALTMLVGCATSATKAPSVDVTGTWAGDWVGAGAVGSGPVTLTLQQTGANVTGEAVAGGGSPFSGPVTGSGSPFSGPVTGTVSGNALSLSYRGGTGEFTVSGNEMTGATRLSRWTLKRQ